MQHVFHTLRELPHTFSHRWVPQSMPVGGCDGCSAAPSLCSTIVHYLVISTRGDGNWVPLQLRSRSRVSVLKNEFQWAAVARQNAVWYRELMLCMVRRVAVLVSPREPNARAHTPTFVRGFFRNLPHFSHSASSVCSRSSQHDHVDGFEQQSQHFK